MKASGGRKEPVTRDNGALVYESLGFEKRAYWFPDGALMILDWMVDNKGEWDACTSDDGSGITNLEPETVSRLRDLLNARATSVPGGETCGACDGRGYFMEPTNFGNQPDGMQRITCDVCHGGPATTSGGRP